MQKKQHTITVTLRILAKTEDDAVGLAHCLIADGTNSLSNDDMAKLVVEGYAVVEVHHTNA